MAIKWEKVRLAAVWVVISAVATALGTAAYHSERHKDDVTDIAQWRARSEALETQLVSEKKVSDDLRKELDAAASPRCSRPADHSTLTSEIRHIERANEEITEKLSRLSRDPAGLNAEYDRLTKQFQQNLGDLSVLRRQLVCAI
jgi:chromosome segregation ATPase